MAFVDDVNRILRDFEGYTGDGQGGNGALPVGDRSTSRKPINKVDLRTLMVEIAQTLGDPSALQDINDDLDGLAVNIGETMDPLSIIHTESALYVQLSDGRFVDVTDAISEFGAALTGLEQGSGVSHFFAGIEVSEIVDPAPDEWRYLEGVGAARYVIEWDGAAVFAILDSGQVWCNLAPSAAVLGIDGENYSGPGTPLGSGRIVSDSAWAWTVTDARGTWDYVQPRTVSGAPAILKSSDPIVMVLATGESVATGGGVALLDDADKTVTKVPPNPGSSLMLGGSQPSAGMFGMGDDSVFSADDITHFSGAFEEYDSYRGETHGSGMLRWMDESQDFNRAVRQAFLFHSAGDSGDTIAQISKGEVPYANALAAVTKARALAQDIYGTDIWLPAVTLTIGVNDRGSGTTGPAFESAMRQFMIDLRADLAAILPDGHDPVEFLIHQTCSNSSSNGNPIQLVQAALCDELAYAHLAPPIYHLPFNGVHPTPLGYRRMGELTGIPWDQRYRQGDTTTPHEVRPVSVDLTGNIWTVQMAAATFPLVLDTATISAATNSGFEHVDDGGATTITDVALATTTVANDSVQITLSGSPGANPKLRYAYNVPTGNLRDSAAEVSQFETYSLHRWCRTFEVEPTT